MTSGRLSLRLAVPAAFYWSFVPLLQIAGLAAVWPWKRRELSFPAAINRFFASQSLWSFFLCAFAAAWACFPPSLIFSWSFNSWLWYGPPVLVLMGAAWLDYGFFRTAAGRSPAGACRDLAIERAIAWTLGLAWFLGSSGWQAVAARLGL
jgi:hypothetical protein